MRTRETDITDIDLLVLSISLETYIEDAHHFDSKDVYETNKPIATNCLNKVENRVLKFSNDEILVIHRALNLRKAKISFLTNRNDDAKKLENLDIQSKSIDLLLHAFDA